MGEYKGDKKMKTKATQGFCKRCHHGALLSAKHGGLCLPCACWSTAAVKHHHNVTLSGTVTVKGTKVAVPLSQIKSGKTCPFCKKR